MTEILLPTPITKIMAHSTSLSTSTSYQHGTAVIELPRYRARRSDASDAKQDETPTDVARYDSFDSTSTSDIDKHKLKHSDTLTSAASFPQKPVIRRLVFRRHWFHSDMTVYSAQPASTSSRGTSSTSAKPSQPAQSQSPDQETTLQFENIIRTPSTGPQPNCAQTEIETPAYHLATYAFNLWQPDIIMYSSATPDPAHVLAVAHFRWSRRARLGFGREAVDNTSPSTTWEELRNLSSYLLHGTYEFSLPDPSSPSGSGRRHFRLQHTRAAEDGVEGWLGWLSCRNYRLIDLEAHETVGVFLADNLRSLTRKGELRLFRALGKEVEIGVVLAVGVLSEKATRRQRHRHNGGCGGC